MNENSFTCSLLVGRGKERVDWARTRRRLSLLGEGETGSPRRRLRARDTAVVGAGGSFWANNAGKGSGEGERVGLDFLGVAKGFGLFLGEKGLTEERGGVGSGWRGFGKAEEPGVDSFLYSLYFSAKDAFIACWNGRLRHTDLFVFLDVLY